MAVRRRWGRIGVGAAAATVGAWVFAALYLSAGDRVDVLVVEREVERFEVIERGDLRVVRFAEGSGVASVPASQLGDVVGRVAAVELVAGSLLADGQLLAEGAQLLGEDEAVVGVLLGAGEGPATLLSRGTPVLVVVRPATGAGGDTLTVEGWVFAVPAASTNGRDRPLEVVVPRGDADVVSAAAADRRVSIVALAE